MHQADRQHERERLLVVLIHIRDQLDHLIGHLEGDVLPPRMVAASAQHLMSSAMDSPAFSAELEPRRAHRLRR